MAQESAALLQYYKDRVDDFEAERADLLRRIATCSASAAECHTLRTSAQKRAEEVRELQQALSAAHLHLFEERDRLLKLQAENDELRMQEAEDRRRISHLMALTDSVDQQVTLQPGAEPTSGITQQCHSGRQKQVQPCKYSARAPCDTTASQRVLRTVYLPAANADALQLKVESLQTQLAEHQQLSQERVAALHQDRTLREQDAAAHCQNYQQQISELTVKVQRLEEALRTATTDYIVARRATQVADAKAAEAATDLAHEKSSCAAQLDATKKSLEDKVQKLRTHHEGASGKEAALHAKQLRAREMEIGQLESLHATVKAQLEGQVEELEVALTKARAAAKQAETRRLRDAEGFSNDVTRLRQQVTAVDRKLHQMRLQARLPDDERLPRLLRAVHGKNSAPAAGLGASAQGDIKKVARGIHRLEDRLRSNVLQPVNTQGAA